MSPSGQSILLPEIEQHNLASIVTQLELATVLILAFDVVGLRTRRPLYEGGRSSPNSTTPGARNRCRLTACKIASHAVQFREHKRRFRLPRNDAAPGKTFGYGF
jgi:hypothetical protein